MWICSNVVECALLFVYFVSHGSQPSLICYFILNKFLVSALLKNTAIHKQYKLVLPMCTQPWLLHHCVGSNMLDENGIQHGSTLVRDH